MKVRYLFLIAVLGINYHHNFSEFASTHHLSNRRVRTLQLFITAQELFAECDRNSESQSSFFDPEKQLPHGKWFYGQVGIGEIRQLKGVKFDPPLIVVAKRQGGGTIHLLCAILNEYWQTTGEVPVRNVPYILTPFGWVGEDGAYFYEFREGEEKSPPQGVYTRNPWTGEAEEKRLRSPFLAKLLELGLRWNLDIAQSDDGRVGKHWIEGPNYDRVTHEDGWLIGYDSISTDGKFDEKFTDYLKEHETRMREALGYKYELLESAFLLMSGFELSEEEGLRLGSRFYQLFSRYQEEIWNKILAERGITPP